MKKELVKFGTLMIVVLLTVAALDITVGKMMDWMLPRISNQGDTGKTFFSLNEVNTSVVIVGSSRASHHYVTQMVEDSLGLSSYNVGRNGCFFSYNCCVINSILDRYSPQLIIWENGREFLSNKESDPLKSLYPYYGKNRWVTKTAKEELPWTERAWLISNTYRYNSSFQRVVLRFINRHNIKYGTTKGYQPMAPKSLKTPLELRYEPCEKEELSETKVARFHSVLKRAREKGVQMIIVDSPRYQLKSGSSLSGETQKKVCQEYGIYYMDNSQLPYFLERPELFNDYVHMNDKGAKAYTGMFLSRLRSVLNKAGFVCR